MSSLGAWRKGTADIALAIGDTKPDTDPERERGPGANDRKKRNYG